MHKSYLKILSKTVYEAKIIPIEFIVKSTKTNFNSESEHG